MTGPLYVDRGRGINEFSVTGALRNDDGSIHHQKDSATLRIAKSTGDITVKPHGLATRISNFFSAPSQQDKADNERIRQAFVNDLKYNFPESIVEKVLLQAKFIEKGANGDVLIEPGRPLTAGMVKALVTETRDQLAWALKRNQETETIHAVYDRGEKLPGSHVLQKTTREGEIVAKPDGILSRLLRVVSAPAPEDAKDNEAIRNRFVKDMNEQFGEVVATNVLVRAKFLEQGPDGLTLVKGHEPLTAGTVQKLWDRADQLDMEVWRASPEGQL